MCKPNQIAADSLRSVNMAKDVIKKVEMFCYLGNVLCSEVEFKKH